MPRKTTSRRPRSRISKRDDFTLRDHPTTRGIDWKSLPTLPDLLSGRIKGRENDQQVTGFVNNISMGAQFARSARGCMTQGSWMVAKGAAGPEVCKEPMVCGLDMSLDDGLRRGLSSRSPAHSRGPHGSA